MDIFDVLKAVSKRKLELMHAGVNEYDALMKAASDVSENYHIPLLDIKRLVGQGYNDIKTPCQAVVPTAVPVAVPVRRE
ncbi:MAG: hypothetical protein OIN66_06850 [Candidatus Methanoperedens sp.]|nr:hypothetical protein [Candidatus Methanoperedens sp.]